MSKQRIIKDEIWDDEWFYDLDPVEKLVWIFLLTNARCNIAGVYKLNYKWAARMIGLDLDIFQKIINRFVRDERLFLLEDWVVIKNFTKHQAKNPSVIAGIKRTIDELPDDLKEYMSGLVDIDDIKFISVGTHKKKRVIERDGGACVRCQSEHLLEVDHIIPVCEGGDNNEENLQTLCRRCHREKTKVDMSRQTVPDGSTLLNSTLLNANANTPSHSQRSQKTKVVKSRFGELKNVYLTIEEKDKLKELYGTTAAKDYVERLSLYLGSKNKRYSSHYAVLRNWMKRDRVELVQKAPAPVLPAPIEEATPEMKEKVDAIRKKITSNLKKNV